MTSNNYFDSVEQLQEIVTTLDQAEVRPVFVGDEQSMAHQGIWNLGTDSLSVIASDNYSLVNHQAAFGLLAHGLEGRNFYGQVYNYNDYVACNVFFPELKVKDDADGIDLGMKVVNSYNRSASFKGYATAKRLVCSNGMYLRQIIPDLQFSYIHVGDLDESIGPILDGFFSALSHSTQVVQETIKKAQKDKVVFESEEQVEATFTEILRSPVHAKKLMPYYEPKTFLKPSKWEFYNAITAYISHAEVVPSRVEIYSNWAEKVLLPEYEIKPVSLELASDNGSAAVVAGQE